MAHKFKDEGIYLPESLREHKQLKYKTKTELLKIAKERGVAVEEDSSKSEIINALSKSRGE